MSKKIVAFAIGAVLLLIWAGVSFKLANLGESDSKGTMQELDNYMSEYDNIQYKMYENATVPGSEVVWLIKNIKDDGVKICVTNGSSSTAKEYEYDDVMYTTSTVLSDIADKAKTESYINPNAQFESSITRDANDNITSINFVQKTKRRKTS